MLTHAEEDQIINTFNNKEVVDNFSVVVNYDNIAAKNYSLSAGQYFEVKIEYVDITEEEFNSRLGNIESNLTELFGKSRALEISIEKQLAGLKYERR